jgi:TolC family type I secretion outer membrane protein
MIYLNNLKKSKLIALAAIALIPEAVLAYSVQDAIIDAHEQNYSIMSKLEGLRTKRLSPSKQLMSEFLPDVKAGAQYNKTDYQRYPGAAIAQQYPNSKSFTISQSLFNSGGSWARMKAVSSEVDAEEAKFIAQSQKLSFDTVQAYEDIITKRALYDLNLQNHKLAAETLEYTQIRFKHGEVTKTDVLQAEANYAQSIAGQEKAIGDLRGAEGTLERLIGKKSPDELEPIAASNISLPPNLDEFINFALENNPSYLASKYTVDQADYAVLSEASKVLPSVSATAQTSRSNRAKASSTNTDGTTYSLNVSIPIVPNGGADFVSIFQAKHQAKGAKFDYRELERVIRENSLQAWSDYKSSLAQLKAQKENIDFSEKSFQGVKEEEKIGTRTTLDVLKAQQDLFNARISYQRVEQQLIEAIYTILSLTGQIDTINIENRE